MDIQREFYKAILNNDIENVKLFLNNKKVNPRQNNNWAFELAVNTKNYNIVELLLIDNRIDPSDYDNYYIKFAFNKQYSNIVDLLWQNQRVKDTLKNNDINFYNALIQKNKIKNF